MVRYSVVSGVEVSLSSRAGVRRCHLGFVRDVFWVECEDELVVLHKGDGCCERCSRWESCSLGECLGCGKDWD